MRSFEQGPGELLDYKVNWDTSTGLQDGETIVTSEWESDLTVAAEANDDTTATVWLSGGTVGRAYLVTNKVSTTASRSRERSFLMRITRRG